MNAIYVLSNQKWYKCIFKYENNLSLDIIAKDLNQYLINYFTLTVFSEDINVLFQKVSPLHYISYGSIISTSEITTKDRKYDDKLIIDSYHQLKEFLIYAKEITNV
mgnify:FL=1